MQVDFIEQYKARHLLLGIDRHMEVTMMTPTPEL